MKGFIEVKNLDTPDEDIILINVNLIIGASACNEEFSWIFFMNNSTLVNPEQHMDEKFDKETMLRVEGLYEEIKQKIKEATL